jgi:hypothetical protein
MGVKLYILIFAGIFVFLTSVFITLYLKALYEPTDLNIQIGVYAMAQHSICAISPGGR